MVDSMIHFANILFLPMWAFLFSPGHPGSGAWKIQFSFWFFIKIIFSHFVSEIPFLRFVYFDCPRFFLDSVPEGRPPVHSGGGRGPPPPLLPREHSDKKIGLPGWAGRKGFFGNNRLFRYLQGKKKRNGPNAAYCVEAGCWCRWRDLNPYGIATGGF